VTRARLAALGVALVAATGAAACGSSAPPAAAPTTTASSGDATAPTTAVPPPAPDAAARPYEVDVVELTLVDPSRPVTDAEGTEVAAERTLPTVVHVPRGDGPFPFVAFAHGFGGDPQRFSQLLGAWAEAGYVVAAPTFPITSAGSPYFRPEAWVGIADQPGDISFVIDEVLRLTSEDGNELSGTVDPDRIAAAGMSLGGGTTFGVAFNDCCRDNRLDAVTIISGIPFPVGGELDLTGGLPTFVIHGDADATLPYARAEATFAELEPPKFLLTLFGGSHSPPSEDWESPWDTVVETTTVDFWDAYLATAGGEPDETAIARLETDAVAGDVATLDANP
jgi:fermentation-respiration switch protein FrsA (DUF1100 family)